MSPTFARPLLATEHTDFDIGAERVAFELARRSGQPLRGVLPYATNPEFEVAAPAQAAKTHAEARERADRVEADAAAAGATCHMHARGGSELGREIVDEAKDTQADLIVIRRRGRRGFFARVMVGEMVTQVLAQSPCSVLVAPRAVQSWQGKVLLAIDPHAAAPALCAYAADVARGEGRALHVVSIAADEASRVQAQAAVDAALRLMAAQHAGQGRGTLTVTASVSVDNRPGEAIPAAASAAGADLIVVGRRTGDAATQAGLGRTAKEVIGVATCCVLVHVPTQVHGHVA